MKNTNVTGLDCDAKYHNAWELAEIVPDNVPVILQEYGKPYPHIERLLAGDWPAKRNIILITEANNTHEAKELLQKLKRSIPNK